MLTSIVVNEAQNPLGGQMTAIYVDSNSEFYNTYKLYREYIGYTEPYSYRAWMKLPENFKAAALYVQFYNEITLAWYKVKTNWSIEEEGVETINQYLIKNVSKIKGDKKRFKPAYIYKVAYNCLYCLCIDPSKNKDRFLKETSADSIDFEGEMSWYDFIGVDEDAPHIIESSMLKDYFQNCDNSIQIFIEYVLGECTEYQTYCKIKKQVGYEVSKDRGYEVSKFCSIIIEQLRPELCKLFE